MSRLQQRNTRRVLVQLLCQPHRLSCTFRARPLFYTARLSSLHSSASRSSKPEGQGNDIHNYFQQPPTQGHSNTVFPVGQQAFPPQPLPELQPSNNRYNEDGTQKSKPFRYWTIAIFMAAGFAATAMVVHRTTTPPDMLPQNTLNGLLMESSISHKFDTIKALLTVDPEWIEAGEAYSSIPPEERSHRFTSNEALSDPQRGLGKHHTVYVKPSERIVLTLLHIGKATLGWPWVVHGGLTATLLNEACERASGYNWDLNVKYPAEIRHHIVVSLAEHAGSEASGSMPTPAILPSSSNCGAAVDMTQLDYWGRVPPNRLHTITAEVLYESEDQQHSVVWASLSSYDVNATSTMLATAFTLCSRRPRDGESCSSEGYAEAVNKYNEMKISHYEKSKQQLKELSTSSAQWRRRGPG